jgi:hypothetical protein
MLLGGTPGSSARTVVHADQSPDALDHELDLHRRHAISQACQGQVWAKRPLSVAVHPADTGAGYAGYAGSEIVGD